MAYGIKYYAIAKGLSPSDWRVDLLAKDYTGSQTELRLVGEGVKIGYDRQEEKFSNIFSRYAYISLKVTNTFNLDTLQSDQERDYQVRIYKGGVLEFVGWITPFSSSQEYEFDTTLTIIAKDGINQLTNVDFVDKHPDTVSQRQSTINVIIETLRECGYDLLLETYYNKYEDSMNKTINDDPLVQAYINVDSFDNDDNTKKNLRQVLEMITITHNLRLYQGRGKWILESTIEKIDGVATGRRFNELNEYITNFSLNSDIVKNTGFKIKRNSNTRKDIPFQQFSTYIESNKYTNLIPNGKFKSFSGLNPNYWIKVGTWSVGETEPIEGGGLEIDNTYTIDYDGIGGKYIESQAIDITGLSDFQFTAEVAADSDIDSVKIAIILFNSNDAAYKYYVDNGGIIRNNPVVYQIDKVGAGPNQVIQFDCKFNTSNASNIWVYANRIQFRIYPGIRLNTGVPVNKRVYYKNLSLTAQATQYNKELVGKQYQYTNKNLLSSKKDDLQEHFFIGNPGFSELYRNSLFKGDSGTLLNKWKRTAESTSYTLAESVLLDKLAMTGRFGDIFEGSVKGYIDLLSTPVIDGKRYLVLFCEYILQEDETEIVATELFAADIDVSFKIFNKNTDGKLLDVSNGQVSQKINSEEKFDTPPFIKQTVEDIKNPGRYLDGYTMDADFLVLNGYVKLSELWLNDTAKLYDADYLGNYTTFFETQNPYVQSAKNVTVKTESGGFIDFFNGVKRLIHGLNDRVLVGDTAGLTTPLATIHAHTEVGSIEPLLFLTNKTGAESAGFAISLDGDNQLAKIISSVPLYADTQKWYFKDADASGLWNYSVAPTSAVNAVADNELVRYAQVKTINDWGQYQGHEDFNQVSINNDPLIYTPGGLKQYRQFGVGFINGGDLPVGQVTNLPANILQGHIIQLGIGEEYPEQRTLLAFGRPFLNYFDGKIYLRGIYGGVDSGWIPVGGGDVQDYSFVDLNNSQINQVYRGIYYEVETGDKHGFVGIDKINGGIIFETNSYSSDPLDNTIYVRRTWMNPVDGRLSFLASGQERKYAFIDEISTSGGSLAYTGAYPITVNSTTRVIGIERASYASDGFLHQSDFNSFAAKFNLPGGGNYGDVLVKSANGNGAEWATLVVGGSGLAGALAPLYVNGSSQVYINKADSATNGYLSATDWTTFNNKLQDGSTLRQTGLTFQNQTYIAGPATIPGIFFERNNALSGIDTTNKARIILTAGEVGAFPNELAIQVVGLGGTALQLYSESGNITISNTNAKISLLALSGQIFIQNIEIDFSGFASGKVLKATSSSKAEWVTP